MLFSIDFIALLSTAYLYFFIYNISLILLFYIFFQTINGSFKTIYSFADLKFNHFFVSMLSILLFSMAGIPPFLGFFSKILILLFLLNSNFFVLFVFFFLLLFFSLYFYLQNVRFLHSTGLTTSSAFYFSINSNAQPFYLFYYNAVMIGFFILFGFFFLDNMFMWLYWILL